VFLPAEQAVINTAVGAALFAHVAVLRSRASGGNRKSTAAASVSLGHRTLTAGDLDRG
jgi:hypothetical protein